MDKLELDLLEFVEALTNNSVSALFIDDSGTSEFELSNGTNVPEFIVEAGVVVQGNKIKDLEAAVSSWKELASSIAGKKVTEIHAAKIVRPDKNNPLHGIKRNDRLELLRKAYTYLDQHVEKIPIIYILQEQYVELMARVPKEPYPQYVDWIKPMKGLETVFIKGALDKLEILSRNSMWVFAHDVDETNKNEFREMFIPSLPIWRSGIVYAPSESLAGLQMADLAAHAINRHYIIERKPRTKKRNRFDDLILLSFKKLSPRIINVLD